MRACLKYVALSALLMGVAHAEEGHGDHEEAWEVAGLYATPDNTYVWTFEKASCEGEGMEKVCTYGDDDHMIMVLLPLPGEPGMAELKATDEDADEAFELDEAGGCDDITSPLTAIVPAKGKCFKVAFLPNQHTTTVTIDTTGIGHIAAYTGHGPKEFERDNHYLKTTSGVDVEPEGEITPEGEVEEEHAEKPWGVSIGAAILVNIVTLIGVVFLVPFFKKLAQEHPNAFSVVINSFAAGAILSAGFYLMMYEATHLIKPPGSTEPEQIGYWGSMILLGFLTAYIIELVASGLLGLKAAPPATTDLEAKTTTASEGDDPSKIIRVRAGILVGDFMHNLADGVFIAYAFLGCGSGFGWTVTGVTIGHEIAQELADYLILVDPNQGNMKPMTALILNFLSGTSVILGVIVLLAQGEEDSFATGMLLAYGGGVYLQIGAADAMPRAAAFAKSAKMRLCALVIFVLGATAIGLVLLNHEHCVPEGGGHAH